MKNLLFSFDEMNNSGNDKTVKEIKKLFKKEGLLIEKVEFLPTKRSSGISYREMHLIFSDSQVVTFAIKQTGDIFKVKINGKELPIKNQDDHESAIKEVATRLDRDRRKFQIAQAKAKMPTMPRISSSAAIQEKELMQKHNELDQAISEAEVKLVELKGQ